MKIKCLAIIQARMDSTRFPGKVLKEINGKSLIEILLYRLSKSRYIDKIVLATSKLKSNDILVEIVESLGYEVFRGSENNVLERYHYTAKTFNAEHIVRITGDCPIIDSKLVDSVISTYFDKKVDYVSNTSPPSYPDGLDVEVFSSTVLAKVFKNVDNNNDREHVTSFIRNSNEFSKYNVENKNDYSRERWTVDELSDFIIIRNIIKHFKNSLDFSWNDVIKLGEKKPQLFHGNKNINRNEGSYMNIGQKLYKHAKNIIPGGTMLLSKRPEMFLPEKWPAYYSKTKGCYVWDMDGNKYVDMSIMGIGTNTLGYSNEQVDSAVMDVVKSGNMSTLNCPEEVYLADKLINLHPWAQMVRFARTGGEVNSIAIRIARAAIGKSKIAICGYHGWHDWYLSANLGTASSLDGHLLPGLEPKGVPANLKDTIFPFRYNNIDELKEIISNNPDLKIIKMEVERSEKPKNNFLKEVRKIATKNNIILIFDECTSGFRETYGGLYKKYNVEPDMMILGKTLGNGYAITAVLGKKEIMKYAEETFISSTFWTERIGPAAALKTLEVMNNVKSWEYITNTGKNIGSHWENLAKKYEIPIVISGIPSLINFKIPVKHWIKYKTLICQEMLKNQFLASNSVYVCIEHTKKIIDEYLFYLDSIFNIISECERGRNIDKLLDGPVCHEGFKRLN